MPGLRFSPATPPELTEVSTWEQFGPPGREHLWSPPTLGVLRPLFVVYLDDTLVGAVGMGSIDVLSRVGFIETAVSPRVDDRFELSLVICGNYWTHVCNHLPLRLGYYQLPLAGARNNLLGAAEDAGFEHQGDLHRGCYLDGRFVDVGVFRLVNRPLHDGAVDA